MTREEFITRWQDAWIGLVLGSFAQVERTGHKMATDSYAEDGKFMLAQMQRGQALLGRMYDDAHPKPPAAKPAENGQQGAKR